jgi:hypothetical protein
MSPMAGATAIGDMIDEIIQRSAPALSRCAAWIEASTGDLDAALSHVRTADALATSSPDVALRARCSHFLAYVVSHQGHWQHALDLTDQSAALYAGLARPWEQAANALLAARAAKPENTRRAQRHWSCR